MSNEVTIKFDDSLTSLIIEKFFQNPSINISIPFHLQRKEIRITNPHLIHWFQTSSQWLDIVIPRITSLTEIQFQTLTEHFFLLLLPNDQPILALNIIEKQTLQFNTCWTFYPRQKQISVNVPFDISSLMDIHSELFEHFSPKKKSIVQASILDVQWYKVIKTSGILELKTIPVYLQGKVAFYIPHVDFETYRVSHVIEAGFTNTEIRFLTIPDQWQILPDRIQEPQWNVPLLSLDNQTIVQIQLYASHFQRSPPLKLIQNQSRAFYTSSDKIHYSLIKEPNFDSLILNVNEVIAVEIPTVPNHTRRNYGLSIDGKNIEFDEIIIKGIGSETLEIQNWNQIGLLILLGESFEFHACPQFVSNESLDNLAKNLQVDKNDLRFAQDGTLIFETILVFISTIQLETLVRMPRSHIKTLLTKCYAFDRNVFKLENVESVIRDGPSITDSRLAYEWIDSNTITFFTTPLLEVKLPQFEDGSLSFQSKSTEIAWPSSVVYVQNVAQMESSNNLDFMDNHLVWGNRFLKAEMRLSSYLKFHNKYYHTLQSLPMNSDPSIITVFRVESDGHTVAVSGQKRFLRVTDTSKPVTVDNLSALPLLDSERNSFSFDVKNLPSLEHKNVYYFSNDEHGIEQYIVGNDTISSLLSQCLKGSVKIVPQPLHPEVALGEEEEQPVPLGAYSPEGFEEEIPPPPGFIEDLPLGEEDIPPPPEEELVVQPKFLCKRKTLIKDNQRIFVNKNGNLIIWEELQELLKDELANAESKEVLAPVINRLRKTHDDWKQSIASISSSSNLSEYDQFLKLPWEFYGAYWMFTFKSWKTLYLNPTPDLNRVDLFLIIITSAMPTMLYEKLFPSLKTAYDRLVTPNGPWCWPHESTLVQAMEGQFSAEVFDHYMEHGFGFKIQADAFLCSSTDVEDHFKNVSNGLTEKEAIGFKTRWDKYIRENVLLWGGYVSMQWFTEVTGMIRASSISLQEDVQKQGIKEAVISNREQFDTNLKTFNDQVSFEETKELKQLWLGSSPISKFVPLQKMQVLLIEDKMESIPSPDQFTAGLWKFLIDKTTPDFYTTYITFVQSYEPNSPWKDDDFQTLSDLLSGKVQPKSELQSKEKDVEFQRLNLFFGLNYEVEPRAKNPKPHKIASRFVVLQKKLLDSSPILDLRILELIKHGIKIVRDAAGSGSLSQFDVAIANKILRYFDQQNYPTIHVKTSTNDIESIDPSKIVLDGEISYAISCPAPKLLQPPKPDFVWNEYNFIVTEMKEFNMPLPTKEEENALQNVFNSCSSLSHIIDHTSQQWIDILYQIYGKTVIDDIINDKNVNDQVNKIADFKSKLSFISQMVVEYTEKFKSDKFDGKEKSSSDIIVQLQQDVKKKLPDLSPADQVKEFGEYATKIYVIAITHFLIKYLISKFDLNSIQTLVFQDLIKSYL